MFICGTSSECVDVGGVRLAQMPLIFYDLGGFGIAWDGEFEEKMKIKTTWTKLLDLDFYTEGPALDREGNLYFTTLTGGAILKRNREGELTEWARLRCPNGQRILENGHHLVCDTMDRSVVELDAHGDFIAYKVREVCADTPFQSPNDLVVDELGGIYFTDSVREIGQVFYIAPKGDQVLVAAKLDYPNGIALSGDGNRLFVAESTSNRILSAELSGPGVLHSSFEVFVDLPENPIPEDPDRLPFTANLPDGIAWDAHGRLWVAHYGMGVLQVIGSEGDLVDSIPTGIPATSNLCIAPDGHSIYVTGGTAEPGPGSVHKISIESF